MSSGLIPPRPILDDVGWSISSPGVVIGETLYAIAEGSNGKVALLRTLPTGGDDDSGWSVAVVLDRVEAPSATLRSGETIYALYTDPKSTDYEKYFELIGVFSHAD